MPQGNIQLLWYLFMPLPTESPLAGAVDTFDQRESTEQAFQ